MAGERRESDGRDGRAARALHSGLLLGYAMSHTDCTSVSVRYNALRTRFTLDTKLQLTWCLNPSCGELLPCMRLLASRNVSRRTAAPSQPQRDDSPRHEPRCRRYTMMTMMTVSVRSLPMPRSDKFNEHRGAIEGPSARTGMDCYECSDGLAVLTHRARRYSQWCCVAPALAPSRPQGHGVTESPRSRRAFDGRPAASRIDRCRCRRGSRRSSRVGSQPHRRHHETRRPPPSAAMPHVVPPRHDDVHAPPPNPHLP